MNNAYQQTPARIAVMGSTGTGKSSFICLVTDDEDIRIGHSQESETFDVQTAGYIDRATNRVVVLVDTPSFDDSREGANSDADVFRKITDFFDPENGERRKLNGIIYLHRISDPRVGGNLRKNLRMFRALCGDNLCNVRIVTTNWNRVSEYEGSRREADLKKGAFGYLIDAGAQMCRHANTRDSALEIISELILLPPVTMKFQGRVTNTDAGQVLAAEIRLLQKKHYQEMADLKKEMEVAARDRNQSLRAELESERKTVQEKLARVEADRAKSVSETREMQKRHEKEMASLRKEMEAAARERYEASKTQSKLEYEHKALEEKLVRVEADRAKSEKTWEEMRKEDQRRRVNDEAERRALEEKLARVEADRAKLEKMWEELREEDQRRRLNDEAERKALEEKLAREQADRANSEKIREEAREEDQRRKLNEKVKLMQQVEKWTHERRKALAQTARPREEGMQSRTKIAMRQLELERQIMEAKKQLAELGEVTVPQVATV